jgi:hypothetical protein
MQMKNSIVYIFLFFSFLNVYANEIVFKCNTPKHKIVITKDKDNLYKYRSWNLKKDFFEKPDLELKRKNASEVQGTRECQITIFTFTSGNTKIELNDSVNCMEGNPPANSVGNLYVYIGNDLKNHYYCLSN